MIRTKRFNRILCSLYGAVALSLGGFGNVAAGPAIAPPNAHPYGKSLADWLSTYYAWSFGPGTSDNLLGRVLLLPQLQPGAPSGSGTINDPLILSGEGAFTIKPGTSIYGVLIAFNGERYEDGSEDPVLPDDWWAQYVSGEVWVDGKRVLDSVPDYYVPPQFFNPPLFYPEPMPTGSVATLFVQGNGFLIHPLSVGTHTIELKAAVLAPADNGIIPETGIRFHYTYSVTVKK